MADYGEPLSERELDVLRCVVNGATNKEVASELDISQNTVKVHLRNIYSKLGVTTRTEATTAALQQGLITIPGMETAVPAPPPADDLLPETTASAEPAPTTAPPNGFNWQIPLALVGLGLVVVLIFLFGRQAVNQFSPAAAPTPVPYVEEVIGQTRWSKGRPLPAQVTNMAAAAVGLDVFQIGGETTAGVVGDVYRYNTIDHAWQEMADKPTAVADSSAAVLFGEIYVPGGRLADGQATNIVEVYSPANNAWRLIANLPRSVSGGLTLSDGSFLYLIGGWDGTEYLDSVYVYDLGNDSWRPLASLPQARAFAAGGAIGGNLFVAGGRDGAGELDTCYVLEAGSDSWAECPPLLTPRAAAGATVLFNKLYVIGGDHDTAVSAAFSEFYDPVTQTWQVVNTPMLEEGPPWSGMGVANVETRIFTLGGQRAGVLLADNFIYTPIVYQTFIPAASSGQ